MVVNMWVEQDKEMLHKTHLAKRIAVQLKWLQNNSLVIKSNLP